MSKKKTKKVEKVEKVDFEDKYMRLQAEFINFKRREEESKAEFVKYAGGNVVGAMLPGIDNLNLAMKHIPEGTDEGWLKGMEASLKTIMDGLETFGIKKMNLEGKDFDPEMAEAIGAEDGEKDKVVKVVQDGYMVHDKVLRLAKVMVGNGEVKTIN